MIKIKLRREWQGQDGWGAYLEEVGVGEDGCLRYRRTKSGNCSPGIWKEWQDEDDALKFMLGPIDVKLSVRAALVVALEKLSDLPEADLTRVEAENVNYGHY